MKKRRGLREGLLCAAMAGLIALGGCGAQETSIEPEEAMPKNDGKPAKLTIAIGESGGDGYSEKLSRVLDEIITKYQADFPNTEIELAEEEGGADIELFSSDELLGSGGDWLMDLTPYADMWNQEGTLSNPANRIMRFKGGRDIWAIPFSYDQIMLYYRFDWFNEYNLAYAATYKEQANVDYWSRLLEVEGKLGEKGRLAISGDVKPYLFDSILWSWVGTGNIADLSAGYYLPGDEIGTIFTLDAAVNAVKMYRNVINAGMDSADPIQDFIDGKAGMYLGTGMDMVELRDTVSGEVGLDWYAVGLPKGNNGTIEPLLGWTAWGVNKDTPEPEKAVHFLWYLTNADNNTHMYMELSDFGVKPIYREVEAYEPGLLEGGWYGEVGLLNEPKYRYASPPLMFGEPVGVNNQVFSGLLDGLESGETTPEEMLEQLDKEYTRLMEEYLSGGNKLPWAREDTEEGQ